MLALTSVGNRLHLLNGWGSLEHCGCHATHRIGQCVQSEKVDSHSYHVRLNTVKRRKTSGCKKKKQKCNSCPQSFFSGENKKLPAQVLSRVLVERKIKWPMGVLYHYLEGTSWLSSFHSVKLGFPDPWWHYMCLHHPRLLVSVRNSGKRVGGGLEFLRDTLQEYWAVCLGKINDCRRQVLSFFLWRLSALLLDWPIWWLGQAEGPYPSIALRTQLLNIWSN